MASIKGRYEYDDDDLTPGKKKEGGLHQNLFDSEGNLKGSARFIPDDEQEDAAAEPVVIYEPVYVYDAEYERQRERERQENAELIAKVVVLLVAVATPHAKRFWLEKALPAIEARKAKRAARKALKAAARNPVTVEATVVDSGQELAVASEDYRTNMSSAEAQARYLAALAARAFSDEQMNLVANANIVDGEGLAELQQTLAELPPQQVRSIIEAVEANPSVLKGDILAELGNLLGLDRVEAAPVAIEERGDQ
ncbi:hypothetical protein [Pimelobacter simplex]|uniref:hypothetical protein n=1 Tax=Nocardioides simplex TaxID=2045 RepID=UPI00214F61AB|nr:hypothetical protein [Pimelobacter simplex]UUW92900.1 hypothetical protein M0M43_30405 [Pimelobacter simplex]UUW98933.1 hypothetical protein M0M48_30425 [Pimelobacter simplex]